MKKLLALIISPLILFSSGITTHYYMAEEIQGYVETKYDNFVYENAKNDHAFTEGSMAADYFRWGVDIVNCNYLTNHIVQYLNVGSTNREDLDFHEYSASLIRDIFNEEGLLRNNSFENDEIIEMSYYLFGMLSHYLEDLYVDMAWQSYLSESYGFGDFTDFKLFYDLDEEYKDRWGRCLTS